MFMHTILFQRKLEREFVMSGGVPVDPSAVTAKSDEEDEQDEQDEDSEPVVSVSGTIYSSPSTDIFSGVCIMKSEPH